MTGFMLGLLLLPIIAVPIGLWWALAASMLWGWFVVPIFNAPPLGVWQAFGIMLVIGAFRPRPDVSKSTQETDWEKVAILAASPAVSMGLGAAIKFWVLA